MKFKIKGINCEACTTMIQMQLDEQGYENVKVDFETATINIPNELKDKVDEIEKIIVQAGAYSLEK